MLFVVSWTDRPNALALRLSVREAHLAYARDTGRIRIGGPFLDAEGNMAGSLMIVEAPDLETVTAWHRDDPYAKAGLFEHSDIRPWKVTFNPTEAKI
jgi:uncharacterized protein YciI